MSEETVTITTHYSVATSSYPKSIRLPARLSLEEAREAIHAAILEHLPEGQAQPSSSIIIASGERGLSLMLLSLTIDLPKALGQSRQTLLSESHGRTSLLSMQFFP
jgi:hypothetical protein